MATSLPDVIHNVERHQFELHTGDMLASLVYRCEADNVINLLHTEVPRPLEGRGYASALASAAIDYAAAHDLTVRPTCPFVRAYLRRHPSAVRLTEPLRGRAPRTSDSSASPP
ncbi:MAG TPA: GNAT family N-acetyltransferase [Gemmatimonadaceae bacterium]|nr:GNAT family N-acetyltransferase [Gemmatimonadaceae bacterium]